VRSGTININGGGININGGGIRTFHAPEGYPGDWGYKGWLLRVVSVN
jgi:hypothetical protein